MKEAVTLQLHHNGAWHDAATAEFERIEAGIRGPTVVDYDIQYFFDFGSVPLAAGHPVKDALALSVRTPVDLENRRYRGWPPFLVDLMPQGHARMRMARILGLPPDADESEFPILLRSAGNPIGNMRIKEASEQEVERLVGTTLPAVETADILGRTEKFLVLAEEFAVLASSASSLQGEWPKVLVTKARDGLWYPDSAVDDADAVEHAIVKMARAKHKGPDERILEAEVAYLEVARAFGLRVGRPLVAGVNLILIPRFDRRVDPARGVVRLGQESMFSAAGRIHDQDRPLTHEDCLAVIKAHCTDPEVEIVEYVLRDLLNLAMGNPDNHGRNTALAKDANGRVALTPVFDFAPMILDRDRIPRRIKWTFERPGGNLDWRRVCEVATDGVMDPGRLSATLAAKADFIRSLPETARRLGVPAETVEEAIRADRLAQLHEALVELGGTSDAPR